MFRNQRPGFLRIQLVSAVMIAFAGSAWADAQADKLLSADADVVVTFNPRELLHDYRDIPYVQKYLDQWRLAAKGDEEQLLEFYERNQVHQYEGISRQEFLERSGMIKAAFDAFGNDPFEDVDLITVGYVTSDRSYLAVIVEGKFKSQSTLRLEQFFQQHLFPVNQGDGPALGLLDSNTFVYADSRKTMETIRARAAGRQSEIPAGVRALLESGRKKHLSVVVRNVETNAYRLTKFVGEELTDSLGTDHAISRFVTGQATEWINTNATDFAAVSIGISARNDEWRLEIGLDAKNAEKAATVRTLIDLGSFLSGQLLKGIDHDLARPLAGILARQQVSLQATTLLVNFDLPDKFVSQARHDPSLDVFPDSRKAKANANANAKQFPGQEEVQNLSSQATSLCLWKSGVSKDEIEVIRDQSYKTGPGTDPYRHRLDMYLPRNKKDFPIIVLVHGGGWCEGDNRCAGLYSSVGEFLASQGIGVVLPNYRLTPDVKHPGHIQDVATAVHWTRSHLSQYGGDVQQLYLLGHSAGGHLVSLLAADESYLKAEGMSGSDIKGVITFSGVYRISDGVIYGCLEGSGPRALRIEQTLPLRGEFEPSWKWYPPGVHVVADVFGSAFGNSSQQRADASPITHVRRDMPPFLIVSAAYDMPTLGPMADEFHAALREKGVDARLLRVPKRNHNSLMFSAITPQDPAARAIIEFVLK